MVTVELGRTREQMYAADIFERVAAIPQAERKAYGVQAHRLPILIRTAGLAQALAFAATRGVAAGRLLDDLAATLGRGNGAALQATARGTAGQSLTEYAMLTRETLTALLWYKRFAQTVLDVRDAGAEGGDV